MTTPSTSLPSRGGARDESPTEPVGGRLAAMLRDFCIVWDCCEEAALARLVREWRDTALSRKALEKIAHGFAPYGRMPKREAYRIACEALDQGDAS